MVSGFTLLHKAPLHENVVRACAVKRDSGGKFALFAFHVVPPCSVRDGTRFLRHRIRKYLDSPVHMLSDSLRIFFFTLEGRFIFFRSRCRIRRIRVDGRRIWKEKRLRIRKYPDTREREVLRIWR